MATRFYLNNATALFVPATTKGAWNTVNSRAFMMGTTKFGGNIAFFNEAETAAGVHSVLVLRGISSPLQAQTISGHLDVIIGAAESAADADMYWHLHVWVSQGDSDVVRGTLVTNYLENGSNEWPVQGTNPPGVGLQAAINLNPVVAVSGDRIIVEMGYVARNATVSSRNGRIGIGTQIGFTSDPAPDLAVGGINTDLKAGSINFDDDILFESVGQIVTYLVAQAAEIPPSTATISHLIAQVAQFAPLPSADISGIYYLNPNKAEFHDSYYNNVENKIPDPTIKTALLGE